MAEKRKYDLEERLLDYATAIIKLVRNLPEDRVGDHVAGQLLRSGTSPLPNHGEAQGAESKRDFTHKLSICHKELRESHRWIRLIKRAELCPDYEDLDPVLQETEELVKIFKASITTARSRNK